MLISLFLLVSGSTAFLVTGTGYPASALNDLSFAARASGKFELVGAVFQISLGLRAFKMGEKWAWFALMAIPLSGLFNSYFDYLQAQPSQTVFSSFIVFAGPTTVALLLTIRRFFPKKQMQPPESKTVHN